MASERLTRETLRQLLQPTAEALGEPSLDKLREIVASPNVIGIGVSEKVRRGRAYSDIALTFYVESKVRRPRVPATERIPEVLRSPSRRAEIITDVVEVGTFAPDALQHELHPGMSIGHVDSNGGTLGALVQTRDRLAVLSNSHVLALSGRAERGAEVIAPSRKDGGRSPENVVGRLERYVPFVLGGEFVNNADAAFALLSRKYSDAVPQIAGVGVPRAAKAARRGMRIVKVGRTTGLTTGVVKDADFNFVLDYYDLGAVGFCGQVLCTRYSSGGDSGSLVLAEKDHRALGLHFASSPKGGSVFTPIAVVLDALDIKLVTEQTTLSTVKHPRSTRTRPVRRAERARRKVRDELRRRGAHAVGVERGDGSEPKVIAYFDKQAPEDLPRYVEVNDRGRLKRVPIDVQVTPSFQID